MEERIKGAGGVSASLVDAYRSVLTEGGADGAFVSAAISLPSTSELLDDISDADPLLLHEVHGRPLAWTTWHECSLGYCRARACTDCGLACPQAKVLLSGQHAGRCTFRQLSWITSGCVTTSPCSCHNPNPLAWLRVSCLRCVCAQVRKVILREVTSQLRSELEAIIAAQDAELQGDYSPDSNSAARRCKTSQILFQQQKGRLVQSCRATTPRLQVCCPHVRDSLIPWMKMFHCGGLSCGPRHTCRGWSV